MRQRSAVLWVFLALLLAGAAWAADPVVPGQGVGPLRLGEPAPARLPAYLAKAVRAGQLALEPSRGPLERITVSSPDFYLARSRLAVGQATLADVVRHYGPGESRRQGRELVCVYPSEGIEFRFVGDDDRLVSFTLVSPRSAAPRAPAPEEYLKRFRR